MSAQIIPFETVTSPDPNVRTTVDSLLLTTPEGNVIEPSFESVPVSSGHISSHRSLYRISLTAISEVEQLHASGVDVELHDTVDVMGLDAEEQAKVCKQITDIEVRTLEAMEVNGGVNPSILYNPDLVKLPAVNDGPGAWNTMLTTAAALHPLYFAATNRTLGDGIDPEVFEKSIILAPDDAGGIVHETALEGLAESWLARLGDPERAKKASEDTHTTYLKFIDKVIDVESRNFLRGSIDGQAIRTRAVAARHLALRKSPNLQEGRDDLVSVSLACGAASPVYSLVKDIERRGSRFSKVILADIDPMALASAHSLAPVDIQPRIELHRRNLLRGKLTDFMEPESADVVDVLGLFEYLPDKLAAHVLKEANTILRPGGVIVFGNMLASRPEQTFFNYGIKWPKLFQRTIAKTLEITAMAGIDQQDISVAVPANQGTYAVVGVQKS